MTESTILLSCHQLRARAARRERGAAEAIAAESSACGP